jgi:hypothetical protein
MAFQILMVINNRFVLSNPTPYAPFYLVILAKIAASD